MERVGLPRRGRPPKISDRVKKALAKLATKKPRVTEYEATTTMLHCVDVVNT